MTSLIGGSETVAEVEPGVLSSRARDRDRPWWRRRRGGKDDTAVAYVMLIPWILGMLFTIIPFGVSLWLAFTDYNLLQPPEWIGLDNFIRLFQDPKIATATQVTLVYTLLAVPISIAAALGLAVLLNRGVRGLNFYRSVFYLPSLIGASVAIVMLWRSIFGYNGIVNQFLGFFGIEGPGWTTDPDWALVTLVTLAVWGFGASMVIFLAGLRQIPRSYYEAASVDGAGRLAAVPRDHAAAAEPGDLLQSRARPDRVAADLHAGLRLQRRHRRPRRVDAVLQPVPLPAGLPAVRHGLRVSDGVGHVRRDRTVHRDQLLRLEVLGFLR